MYLTDIGYLEIEDTDLSILSVLLGGRGLGKTFSVLKRRLLNALNDDMSKFIWLRDTDTVIKKIAAGNSLASPIIARTPNMPKITIEKINGNYCFVTDFKGENERVLGYLMALSTFHNARGINYDDVNCIVWDEFIPEEGTIVKKNQGIIFLNAYESICRNRELEGQKPVQIIFLSNTNDIYSDVLEDLGVSELIENMMYKNEKSYKDNDIWIQFLESKEFYEKKKDTFIYRISNNYKFSNMALDNNFNNNLALIKKDVNFKGSTGLITVDNKYTLIQLKDGSLYFKKGIWSGLANYDMENDQEAILFRLLFHDKFRFKYIAGKMFFDSIYTQRNILEFARI